MTEILTIQQCARCERFAFDGSMVALPVTTPQRKYDPLRETYVDVLEETICRTCAGA